MRKSLLKNVSYVFLANTVSMLINLAINFLVPIFFGQGPYSYYQLENLYCGYLWILTLGWHEGIYIYYCGKNEEEIDKQQIRSQFWLFSLYMIIIFVIAVGFGNNFFQTMAKKYVFAMSTTSVMIESVRYIFVYYLISINDMKRYAWYIIGDRVVYIFFVIALLIVGIKDYYYLIGVDILSKIFLLGYLLWTNRPLFWGRIATIKDVLNHAKMLILSGINVTFASFTSRFINGTVRLAIEALWGILVFGEISLTLSVSNMFTQFIQALSVVLFPILRRISAETQRELYIILSNALDILMFCLFLLYLPGVHLLNFILPEYQESFRYMAILLPICLFDAHNIILDNTYLKAVHEERGVLVSNLIAVFFSVMFTIIIFWLHNLNFAVVSIFFLSVIRSICSRWILKKTLNQNILQAILEEIAMTVAFIWGNWYVSGVFGTLIYVLALAIYMIVNGRRTTNVIKYVLKRSIT